jgi:hypothetical protein
MDERKTASWSGGKRRGGSGKEKLEGWRCCFGFGFATTAGLPYEECQLPGSPSFSLHQARIQEVSQLILRTQVMSLLLCLQTKPTGWMLLGNTYYIAVV